MIGKVFGWGRGNSVRRGDRSRNRKRSRKW